MNEDLDMCRELLEASSMPDGLKEVALPTLGAPRYIAPEVNIYNTSYRF
jgi:hypothetical protein